MTEQDESIENHEKRVRAIIESLLFVSREPLGIESLKRVLDIEDGAGIRAAVSSLGKEYEERQGGFYLAEVAGGFQLRTRPEHKEWIKRLVQGSPPRLSRPALETLAIIAWNQPLIRSEVERIRGVDCGGVIRMLLERNLIRILGRKEIPGRPLIYATTRHFLEVFGMRDIKDLPSPREIESMGAPDGKIREEIPEEKA